MKVEEKVLARFQSLIDQEDSIMTTRRTIPGRNTRTLISTDHDYVDFEVTKKWGISCLHLLAKVFGENSLHYCQFNESYLGILNHEYGTRSFRFALAVLKAAKEDVENDYLFDTRVLIEAEVFDDLLEQAEQLFKNGYYQPAAVVAGCVLEDGLRKLCDRNSITSDAKATNDPMNVELAKAGIYKILMQKKITVLADLRNNAAHGKLAEFTKKDVEDMIRDVRHFVENHFN